MQKTAVIGAAGTGKTRLLTESIACLLEKEELEAAEGKVLILTLSPRTVDDVRARLKVVCADGSDRVIIHTVKSLCEETLKDSNPELHILSDFRSWFILRECIRSGVAPMRSSYASVKDKHSFIRDMLELIEATNANSIPIEQLPNAHQAADKLEDIKSIHRYYKNYCKQRNLLPEFDVIPRASDILSKYGDQFSHLFIDQYEELRRGEIQIIKLLSDSCPNITIFADPVRCDLNSISELWQNSFLSIPLEPACGLRMTGHINRLLGKTVYQISTHAQHLVFDFVKFESFCSSFSKACNDQVVTIAVEETAVDEAEYIARTIKRETSCNGRKYSDFAILCREVERLRKTIRDALEKYSIPCSGGLDISRDPIVQFVILCLRTVAEPHENDVVLKWLSSPVARLNRADVYRAYARAKKTKQELLRMTVAEASVIGAQEAVSRAKLSFQKSCERLKELLLILDFIKSERQNGREIWELVNPILVMSGIAEGNMPQAVVLFTEMIRDIEDTYEKNLRLPVLLNDIESGLKYLASSDKNIYESGDKVRLMSIRESKGLEFPFVFVPGMVSDFLPARYPARQLLYGEDMSLTRAALRDIDLPGATSPDRWREQEKHLLYVAMTRTKEKLYLTFAHQYPENEDCRPSPFLADLLGGKEISEDNCDQYGICYQDHTVSSSQSELPSLEDITSKAHLEIVCYRYIRELERLNHQKAEESVKLLSRAGVVENLLPSVPLKEVAIPHSHSTYFNHTSVRSFLSCPRRYFLAHLLKLEVDYQASAQFGRLIHEVLRIFHSRYPKLCEHDLEDLWNNIHNILIDVWEGKAENKDVASSGYEAEFAHNRLQAQSYLKLADEILRTYLKGEHSRWDENRSCMQTEQKSKPFSFDKYKFRGRMDRIDTCASIGDEIIDFKTSAYDKESEFALKSKFLNMDDDPNYRPQDYQLPIYYFTGLHDKLNPKKLVVYQLRNISRRSGAPSIRELEILPDEDTRSGKKDKFLTKADLESIKYDILITLERMVSGFYPPEPRDNNVCERECEFSFICDGERNDS